MSLQTQFHASALTQPQLKAVLAALTNCVEAGESRERSIKFGKKCAKVIERVRSQCEKKIPVERGSSTWMLDKIVRAFKYSGVKMPKALGEKLAVALDSAGEYA